MATKAKNVSGVPLKFEASLDNSKLKKSIKESLNAILQLKKAGETGITANGAPLNQEIKLRQQVISQLEKQRIKQEELNKAIQRRPAFTASDTAAEIEAAKRGRTGTIASGTVVNAAETEAATAANQAYAVSTQNVTAEKIKQTLAEKADVVAKQEQITSLQTLELRLKSYQNISATATDPVRLATYNKKIQETEQEIARLSNVGKEGFDKFGNAVKGSTNYIGKAWGAVRKLAYVLPGVGIAGIIAFATEPIIEYIQSLDLFKKKIDEVEASRKALSDTMLKGTQSAQKELTDLRLLYAQYQNTNLPLKERKSAYDQLQKLYPAYFGNLAFEQTASKKTKSAYDELTTSILATARARAAADKITENSNRQLDNEQKIKDLEAEKLEIQRKQAVVVRGTAGGANIYASYQGRINDLTKQQNNLKTDSAILTKRNLDLEKEVNKEVAKGGKLTGTLGSATGLAKQIKEAENLQRQVNDILNKYKRKSLTPDQEAEQAINDEFKRIATKVQEFNKNPKNKIKISTDKLEEARIIAISDLRYKQETAKMMIEVENQKQIFNNFEEYKLKFGEQKANERFGTELQGYKKYSDYLKSLLVLNTSGIIGEPTGGEQERQTELMKEVKEAADAEKKKNDELIAQLMDYETKRKLITEQYQAQRADLLSKGKNSEVAVLDYNYKEDLKNLDDANVQKLDSYKHLFEGVEGLTKKQAETVVSNAKSMLAGLATTGLISPELFKVISDKIKETESAIADRLPQALSELAYDFSQIQQSVSAVSETLGEMIGLASQAIRSYSEVIHLADAYKNATTAQDKFIAGAGLVAAGISGIATVIGTITNAAKERKAAEQAYYNAVIDAQHEYNLSLNDQIRLQDELNNNVFLKDYKNQILDGSKALADATSNYQNAVRALSEGRAKLGQRNAVDWSNVGKSTVGGAAAGAAIGSVVPVIGTAIGAVVGGIAGFIGGLFGGKKKKTEYGSLLGEFPELLKPDGTIDKGLAEILIKQNLVDDKTKTLIQDTLDWADKIAEANAQIKDAVSSLAGGLGDNIRNSLIKAFEDGTDAAKSFGDEVGKVIEDIVSQFLFASLFKKDLDQLQSEMEKSLGIGGDGSVTDDLIRFYKNAADKIPLFNAGLQAASDFGNQYGLNLFAKNSTTTDATSTTLSGAIKGITQDQADLLAGQLGGMRLAQIETNNLLKPIGVSAYEILQISTQHLNVALRIEANTGRTAANTDQLFQLADIKTALKNIDRNITSSNGALAANGGKI